MTGRFPLQCFAATTFPDPGGARGASAARPVPACYSGLIVPCPRRAGRADRPRSGVAVRRGARRGELRSSVRPPARAQPPRANSSSSCTDKPRRMIRFRRAATKQTKPTPSPLPRFTFRFRHARPHCVAPLLRPCPLSSQLCLRTRRGGRAEPRRGRLPKNQPGARASSASREIPRVVPNGPADESSVPLHPLPSVAQRIASALRDPRRRSALVGPVAAAGPAWPQVPDDLRGPRVSPVPVPNDHYSPRPERLFFFLLLSPFLRSDVPGCPLLRPIRKVAGLFPGAPRFPVVRCGELARPRRSFAPGKSGHRPAGCKRCPFPSETASAVTKSACPPRYSRRRRDDRTRKPAARPNGSLPWHRRWSS